MPNYLRERWRLDLERQRSPSGNVDMPGLVGRWVSDPDWIRAARCVPAPQRRAVLAEMGRQTFRKDLGRYASELRWNTNGLDYVWPSEEREEILCGHAELLFASTSDALAFSDPQEREEALAEVDFTGQSHLNAALALGRGALLLGVYQSNPRFLVDHPALDGREIGIIRYDSGTGASSSVLFGDAPLRARLLPASIAAVRPILDLLARGQIVALYNDYLFPGSAAVPSPLFGRAAPVSRAMLSIILKARPVVLPIAIARRLPASGRGVAVDVFPPLPLDLEASALAEAAQITGIATECLIRRYPSAWRLWNTLQLRWRQAASLGVRKACGSS